MTKVWKAGALWLAVTVVVWLFTIWRWQTGAHDPGTGEIVAQLVVLPLLLWVFMLGALWGVRRLRAQAAAPIEVPAAAAGAREGGAGDGAKPAALSDEAQGHPSAWILAESVTLAAGHDAASAWDRLRSQSVRPGLDSGLQDVDGLPVFASRVADLDLAEWLQAHGELDQAAMSDEALRGLALLEGPLHELLGALPDVPSSASGRAGGRGEGDGVNGENDEGGPHHGTPDGEGAAAGAVAAKAHLSGVARPVDAARLQREAALAPQLTVRLLLPAHWPEAEREAAAQWLRTQCGGLLDWAQAAGARGVRWLSEPVAHPEAWWDELDRQMVQWSRDARPELWLVLAVDTAVNEARVAHMQAVGELFTAVHQNGRVPGEAAAALLIAHPHWPTLSQQALAPVRMGRPVRARRDKSADAAGRVGAQVLEAVLQQALAPHGVARERLLVVSDADHRASRTAELFEALQETLPGVDPMLAVTRVGEACGDLGLARALVPAALACAALRAADEPGHVAVAAHVQSSHERVAVALAPWRAEREAA